MSDKTSYDVIIIGSGPAGITASIYTIRANLSTLIIAGTTPGGQLMITTDVDDYPGFPGGIQGPELMERMRKQAEMLGVKFINENVTKVNFKKKPFKLYIDNNEYESRAVIIATGASARWMGLESEKKLIGKGVSACATCDGMFFKNKDVVVIGGGDTALREALYLSRICKTITVVHRRNELRAQRVLQDKAFNTENIKFIWNSEIIEFIGKEKLESVKINNNKTNKTEEIKCSGAFVAIGHSPNTKFLKEGEHVKITKEFLNNQVKLDEHGYIVVKNIVKTSVEGVFAAGDVHDVRYKQAVTAAGAGCMAALEVSEYLEELKHKKLFN